MYEEWEDTEFSTAWCYENFVQFRSLRRARDIREQLVNMLGRVELELERTEDMDNVKKSVLSGFFYHTASGQWLSPLARRCGCPHLHPSTLPSSNDPTNQATKHSLCLFSVDFNFLKN